MESIKRLIAPRKCENSSVLPSAAYSVPARVIALRIVLLRTLSSFIMRVTREGKFYPCFFVLDRSGSFSLASIMCVRKIGDLWGGAKHRRRFQMRHHQEVTRDSPLARLNSWREKREWKNKTIKISTLNAVHRTQMLLIKISNLSNFQPTSKNLHTRTFIYY